MLSKFEVLYELVVQSAVNVTAIKDRDDFFHKHILDSVYYFEQNKIEAKTLADIGSGGGFPGLPIAISRPDLTVTLVESVKKKCVFLNKCIQILELSNVLVENRRAENIKGVFDIITSRGVGTILKVLKLTKHLAHKKTFWLIYKGEKVNEELKMAENFIQKERLLFKITRVETPFTRSYLKITNNPLV